MIASADERPQCVHFSLSTVKHGLMPSTKGIWKISGAVGKFGIGVSWSSGWATKAPAPRLMKRREQLFLANLSRVMAREYILASGMVCKLFGDDKRFKQTLQGAAKPSENAPQATQLVARGGFSRGTRLTKQLLKQNKGVYLETTDAVCRSNRFERNLYGATYGTTQEYQG